MRATDWKRLAESSLSGDWGFSGSLAYLEPIGWVLHGLLAEGSRADSTGFYLWMVRMPLVVPSDVVDLSWSERFGAPSKTLDPKAQATRQAIEEAATLVSKQAISGGVVVDPPGGADNVRMQEARAYGLILDGNLRGATEVLIRVLRYKPRYEWQQELAERAADMLSLVDDGRRDEAVRRLESWRFETLRALRIKQEVSKDDPERS